MGGGGDGQSGVTARSSDYSRILEIDRVGLKVVIGVDGDQE